jgi:hypothetical protein
LSLSLFVATLLIPISGSTLVNLLSTRSFLQLFVSSHLNIIHFRLNNVNKKLHSADRRWLLSIIADAVVILVTGENGRSIRDVG